MVDNKQPLRALSAVRARLCCPFSTVRGCRYEKIYGIAPIACYTYDENGSQNVGQTFNNSSMRDLATDIMDEAVLPKLRKGTLCPAQPSLDPQARGGWSVLTRGWNGLA